MTGFDYGNARIRARRTRLLDRRGYIDLMAATSVDRLTGLLGETGYASEIEAALPAHGGVRRVDVAVGLHLERELGAVRSFYDEPQQSRLSVILGRWDVKNLIALVRTLTRRSAVATEVEALVPTGRIPMSTLRELATQPGIRSMVDLMVTWSVPSRRIALATRAALSDLETTGDSTAVEIAIVRGFDQEVQSVIDEAPGDALSRTMKAERARSDLVTAARLRAARGRDERIPGDVWLGVPNPGLVDLVHADDLESALADLGPQPPGFVGALRRWIGHGDPARLSDDLDRQILGIALRAATAEPLGMGVPVGYLWAVENEARNLRLVARAVAGDLDTPHVEQRLVAP